MKIASKIWVPMASLKTAMDKGGTGDYRPEINPYSKEGRVINCFNNIAKKNNI